MCHSWCHVLGELCQTGPGETRLMNALETTSGEEGPRDAGALSLAEERNWNGQLCPNI